MTGIVNDLTSTFEIVRRLCGDKWKFLIICYLFNGPKRYGELQYHLDSIKPKVLTENLKELEDLGIIQRTSYEGNTLHVEYCLTHLGETLQPIFQELIMWGLNYSQESHHKPKEKSANMRIFLIYCSIKFFLSYYPIMLTLSPVLFA